jgi:hypothetical protein
MGYLKFKKAGTAVDLLPAENIMHVTSSGTTDCKIVYNVALNDAAVANVTLLEATIVIASAEASTDTIRKAVNDAIEIANGTNDAVVVDFVNAITSVSMTSASIA